MAHRTRTRATVGSDPYWIKAKYAATCGKTGCAEPILAGASAFYYPNSRQLLAQPCGHADQAAADFTAHAADERLFE